MNAYHSWNKKALHLIREGVNESTGREPESHDGECAIRQEETNIDQHEDEADVMKPFCIIRHYSPIRYKATTNVASG